ncbi:MAG: hypothetical protein GTO24_02555 [candidate division Zixibacteria bacterium]|nr:hypothetical protein [candidate division Zixibacteria bacterium]
MGEDRQKILSMLAKGKINVSEAEKLLDALGVESEASGQNLQVQTKGRKLNYFRVQVEPKAGANCKHERVNIRIPLQILRAGVKLGSFMPPHVKDKVNDRLKEKGLNFDISSLDGEKFEELIEALTEFSVDVDSDKEKVRIFCE